MSKNMNKNKGNPKNSSNEQSRFFRSIVTTIFILLLVSFTYSFFADRQSKVSLIPISELAQDVLEGKVKEIVVNGTDLVITYTDGTEKNSKKEDQSTITDVFTNYGVTKEKLSGVSISVKADRKSVV